MLFDWSLSGKMGCSKCKITLLPTSSKLISCVSCKSIQHEDKCQKKINFTSRCIREHTHLQFSNFTIPPNLSIGQNEDFT